MISSIKKKYNQLFAPSFETPVMNVYNKAKENIPYTVLILFCILVIIAYITISAVVRRYRNRANKMQREILDEELEDQSQISMIFVGIFSCIVLVFLMFFIFKLNENITVIRNDIESSLQDIDETVNLLKQTTIPSANRSLNTLQRNQTLNDVDKLVKKLNTDTVPKLNQTLVNIKDISGYTNPTNYVKGLTNYFAK